MPVPNPQTTDLQSDNQAPVQETVLVAHVTVHLQSGESFELLPFLDGQDVKAQVTSLIEDWCKSGYLVRGNRIYPWHQVKLVEATSVEELTRRQAEQRMLEFQTLDLAHMQQSFWKTKQPHEPKQDQKSEKEEGGKE